MARPLTPAAPDATGAPRYMTTNEAARYIRVGRNRLFRMSRDGRIPYIKLDPRNPRSERRYDRQDLDAHLAGLKVLTVDDPAADLDAEDEGRDA